MFDIRRRTELVYERYADMLYRLAYARLRNDSDAQDAVAETFAKYLRKRPEFHDESHEKAWFLRVCTNTCHDMTRRRTIRSYTPLEELSEVLCAEEKDKSVLESVYELPEKYRMCILLYYFEDFSVEDTAKALNLSSSAVKMRLSRAREMLKSVLV